MPQVNVDLSDEQFNEWTDWVDEDETPHNTKSDLIRTAVTRYIHDSSDDRNIDDVEQVVSLLTDIRQDISGIADTVEEAQREQLDSDEVSDTVNATVRRLMYEAVINNEAVEGINLVKDE